ncbi:MAG TPA: hypothetical protein VGV93_03480 [Acidimicrobiales bacterium]|nr:hypothetical protein [Acidimicrobiales bacterium]
MQSRQVLAQLSGEGIKIHRETLARVSDELGLRTRPDGARGVPRAWSAEQVDQIIAHFRAAGWKPTEPVRRRSIQDSSGPFRTRDVLAFLADNGFSMHRETLARISDDLGLHTRDLESPTVPRQWTRHQVNDLLRALRSRLLSQLATQDLRALLDADPSLAERLHAALHQSPPAGSADRAATAKEDAA